MDSKKFVMQLIEENDDLKSKNVKLQEKIDEMSKYEPVYIGNRLDPID